ncbi:MAG: hydantoinase B/oxoprolinase family protein, partial [Pseudomonadales bacterium]
LFQRGVLNAQLMEIIRANVRDPVVAEGDLYSLAACNDAGSVRLRQTLQEFGQGDVTQLGEHIVEVSRRAMEAAIQELPEGQYHHSTVIDGYDQPLTLRCGLTVTQSSINIDFAGSPAASAYGINVPLPYTQAYASFGVRCIVGGEIPNNAGSLAPIRVQAAEGSLLAALPPSAVSARHAVGQMLPDLVLGCVAQFLPEAVPAEGASCIWNPVLRGPDFVINPIFNGGTGARPGKDGLSTTAFPSGVRTTSTEINEVTAPLVFWQREYAVDSAGRGRLRGGLGQTLEIAHRHDQAFTISKMFDRLQHPAAGRDGGESGAPGVVALLQDGDARLLAGKGVDQVPAGARLRLQTPGGGGIGPIEQRSASLHAADVAAGLVSDGP